MYDPMTVAFNIKSPFWHTDFTGHTYRTTLVTIWHVDPENTRGMCVRRSDDTCGWFTPPYSQEDHNRMHKLAKSQYTMIFDKQNALTEGKDYAYICYEPTAYDAIYWSWRAIKHSESKRRGWQYGKSLSPKELNYIYSLYANPVDNLRVSFSNVKDIETFVS